uniref:Phytocyanin domain-containing protein n=1 Tax=Kalanchoe fedtschenkoi TaxID=63787 RepID=A0A7N0T4V5_KALFE
MEMAATESKKVLIVMMFAVMLVRETQAAKKHIVGGSQGWDESSDFRSWASSQTFRIGDQLVFKYTPGLHSVVELAGSSAYDKCDISTATDSKSSGEDVIKLTKPGTRYFACGTLGHCEGGMKLKITTVSEAATNASPSPSSSDDSPSSSMSSTGSTHLMAVLVMILINIMLIRGGGTS